MATSNRRGSRRERGRNNGNVPEPAISAERDQNNTPATQTGSLRSFTTPNVLSNTIRQLRQNFDGAIVLLEGDTDSRWLKPWTKRQSCKAVAARGREHALETFQVLEEAQFKGILAIVDSDFWRLEGDAPSSPNLLTTDTHDLETMIFRSPAFEKILLHYGSEQQIELFQNNLKISIRDHILSMAVEVGILRWLNSKNNYGLSFQSLRLSNLIDTNSYSFRKSELVGRVMALSGRIGVSAATIEQELNVLRQVRCDPWQICQGHDFTQILSIGLRTKLGSCSNEEVKPEKLEQSVHLAYEYEHFRETALYVAIKEWEAQNGLEVLLPVPAQAE